MPLSLSSTATDWQQCVALQVGKMNKLLQNVNLAGTGLFLQILGVSKSIWRISTHCTGVANEQLASKHRKEAASSLGQGME